MEKIHTNGVDIIPDDIDIKNIYEREASFHTLHNYLDSCYENRNDLSHEKGIYVYGKSGVGKTHFVISSLKKLNYDVIYYDAGDIRNKNVIENLTKRNMSTHNVLSLFKKEKKRIVIVMDEIDGMNTGDKGGINSLIKLIRPKKTKKQRKEDTTSCPVICIGDYCTEKKIKELMNVCKPLEISVPLNSEISKIVKQVMPKLNDIQHEQVITFIQSDLRKLHLLYTLYCDNPSIILDDTSEFLNIFHTKNYNEDSKKITKEIIYKEKQMGQHNEVMNEADRTIVALLWHENIIDVISKIPNTEAIPLYLEILNNTCFADYIDRITFQKQIWQFNEMSSLIKTFKTNHIIHQHTRNKHTLKPISEIRFTKILTKYSTEYNNSVFIQNLCQLLDMDKKDIYSFFTKILQEHDENIINILHEDYDINQLDINRMEKYLTKYSISE